jgi:hypothetical protein
MLACGGGAWANPTGPQVAAGAAVFAGTLVHSGDIRATTASLDGGHVVLSAQKDAIVQSGGVIHASGAQGGEVVVQGDSFEFMTYTSRTGDFSNFNSRSDRVCRPCPASRRTRSLKRPRSPARA